MLLPLPNEAYFLQLLPPPIAENAKYPFGSWGWLKLILHSSNLYKPLACTSIVRINYVALYCKVLTLISILAWQKKNCNWQDVQPQCSPSQALGHMWCRDVPKILYIRCVLRAQALHQPSEHGQGMSGEVAQGE